MLTQVYQPTLEWFIGIDIIRYISFCDGAAGLLIWGECLVGFLGKCEGVGKLFSKQKRSSTTKIQDHCFDSLSK